MGKLERAAYLRCRPSRMDFPNVPAIPRALKEKMEKCPDCGKIGKFKRKRCSDCHLRRTYKSPHTIRFYPAGGTASKGALD